MGLAFAMAQTVPGQTVSAVPKLDLNQYMGTWYEIARLPTKAEKKCVSDVLVLYALGDKPNSFQMGTSCHLKNGASDVRDADGKRYKKSDDGRLKLTRLVLFSTKYWVLDLAPDGSWALVGSPNHKQLWILSRTAVLSPEVLTALEAKASAQGFKTGKLITVPQQH